MQWVRNDSIYCSLRSKLCRSEWGLKWWTSFSKTKQARMPFQHVSCSILECKFVAIKHKRLNVSRGRSFRGLARCSGLLGDDRESALLHKPVGCKLLAAAGCTLLRSATNHYSVLKWLDKVFVTVNPPMTFMQKTQKCYLVNLGPTFVILGKILYSPPSCEY